MIYRRTVIGVKIENVSPHCERETIALISPQIPFRCEKIFIPLDYASPFVISRIQVGSESFMPTSEEIPASAFSSIEGRELDMARTSPGRDIQIGVRNISMFQAVFRAALIGMVQLEKMTDYDARPV